ncbi:hypothetical protein [Microbacterium sp. NPDC055357]
MNNNYVTIASVLPAKDIPAAVKAAIAFNDYAEKLSAELSQETTPNPGEISTREQLDDALTAIENLHSRQAKAKLAKQVAEHSVALLGDAWFASLTELNDDLATKFNATAKRFTAAATAAGDQIDHYLADQYDPAGVDFRTSLNELNHFKNVRDALASVSGHAQVNIWSNRYGTESRTLVFPDVETYEKFRRELIGASFYIAAHRAGARIEWQTIEQQRGQFIPQHFDPNVAKRTNESV